MRKIGTDVMGTALLSVTLIGVFLVGLVSSTPANDAAIVTSKEKPIESLFQDLYR